MKIKSLVSLAATTLLASSLSYAIGAASEDMSNPADDVGSAATAQNPTLADNSNSNIGSMGGEQLAQADTDATTSNTNDDASADTATGDDDY